MFETNLFRKEGAGGFTLILILKPGVSRLGGV